MKTIRRLYFYAVAAISIEVVLWGVIGLLRSIFNQQEIANNASNLASALALIFVGVPIFLIHWAWAQNVSSKDAEEHTSSVRAIFLYGILLGTLIPAVQNTLAFIDRTLLGIASLYPTRAIVGGSQSWQDNLIAVVINLLIAAYFWNILQKNWRTLAEETEAFSEIRRLARFIWMLYGLLMMVYGAQQSLSYAFTTPSNVLGEVGREVAVNAISLLLVGTPIWFYAWRFLQDGLADTAEKESYLRLGILYLLSLGGFITTLVAGGNLIYLILLQILGEGDILQEFVRQLGGPISIGVPLGAVWAYYGSWLNRQFAFDENLPRREGKQRLYFYILSFLGLGASIFGVLTLFSVLIDQLLKTPYVGESGFAEPLSGALATLVVGLPVWLTAWRRMQTQALADTDMGDHARRSVIRKAFLYLVLFASVIGSMVAAGVLVFELINFALGGSSSFSLAEALNELTALVVFIVVLVYHLSALRADGAARADVLAGKQSNFRVLVLDHNGTFGEKVKSAFAKYAPDVPVTMLNANEAIPADTKADAVVMSGSLAVNTPKPLEAWIRSFDGNKLIVSDEAAGVFWMGDPGQAAESVKSLAEGQEIRPQSSNRTASVWTYVAYVLAVLFACQLLFGLLMFGISLVTGF